MHRLTRLFPALVVVLISCVAAGAATTTVSGSEAFDYAFRFASAIRTDTKDMGKAQESVVLELARAGRLDTALEYADQVTGWRRGTVYADLGSMLVEAGRTDEARTMVARARSVKQEIDGWQQRRIDAHVATTLAKLGEAEHSAALALELSETDPRQYGGRAIATVASGLAASGSFDEALARLGALTGVDDYEAAWWRTIGYVELARMDGLTTEQQLRALEAGEGSAREIPGWKSAQALHAVAEAYAVLGRNRRATSLLDEAVDRVGAMAGTTPVKGTLMAQIGRSFAAVGEKRRAKKLLLAAEAGVPETMVIDRPGIYAEIAAAHHVAGDLKQAARVYDVALGAAEALVNARPRALAVVHLCRTMGREGIAVSAEIRPRLDALYGGLRAPW